jgi:hypothetical protein
VRRWPQSGPGWRQKLVGGAALIVLAPLLLTVLARSVSEAVGIVIELLGQLVPAAIGVVVLIVLYWLLFRQRYR